MPDPRTYPIKIHSDPYGNPYICSKSIWNYAEPDGYIDHIVEPCATCYPDGFTGRVPDSLCVEGRRGLSQPEGGPEVPE